MAEFQGIFCCPFLPSVLIIEGVGQGGVGGSKNHPLGHPMGHPMSSHEAHTVANNTPVGHIASGSGSKYRSPTVQLVPYMGPIVPAVTLEGRQNALHKSRPVII